MNFINKFLEENNIKKQNKAYLKNNMISQIVESLHNNQMDLNKKAGINYNFTERVSDDVNILVDYYNKLKKDLAIQKGRITKQINEQNKEKELYLDSLRELNNNYLGLRITMEKLKDKFLNNKK